MTPTADQRVLGGQIAVFSKDKLAASPRVTWIAQKLGRKSSTRRISERCNPARSPSDTTRPWLEELYGSWDPPLPPAPSRGADSRSRRRREVRAYGELPYLIFYRRGDVRAVSVA